jgi:hypothetical protein
VIEYAFGAAGALFVAFLFSAFVAFLLSALLAENIGSPRETGFFIFGFGIATMLSGVEELAPIKGYTPFSAIGGILGMSWIGGMLIKRSKTDG